MQPSKAIAHSPYTMRPWVGSLGHLTIFGWALAMSLTISEQHIYLPSGIALLTLCAFYPTALHHLMRWRVGMLLALIFGAHLLFGQGQVDALIWGIPVSSQNIQTGLQMVLRALVIFLAATGFTASVQVSELSAIMERVGLPGLGFSLGVAFNMLPALELSARNAWHSLWLRGGLRTHRWLGLHMLLITILSNALRRSEEITLAAEARAYNPEHVHHVLIHSGKLDTWLFVCSLLSLSAILVIKTT